jgi:hypothetical protein
VERQTSAERSAQLPEAVVVVAFLLICMIGYLVTRLTRTSVSASRQLATIFWHLTRSCELRLEAVHARRVPPFCVPQNFQDPSQPIRPICRSDLTAVAVVQAAPKSLKRVVNRRALSAGRFGSRHYPACPRRCGDRIVRHFAAMHLVRKWPIVLQRGNPSHSARSLAVNNKSRI